MPSITLNKLLSMNGTKFIPLLAIANINAPRTAPITEPYPPMSAQPPITAAAIACNSRKSPAFGSDAPEVMTVKTPNKHAKQVEIINKLILTRFTGTPTALAACASPPDAYIQLPNLVRCSMKAVIITRMAK